MAESRRTSEAKKLRPFMAAVASDSAAETSDQDILALVASLNTHRSSADHDARYSLLAHLHDARYSLLAHLHDDRYYTETETNSLLANRALKTLTLTAGNGLIGGGDLYANRTFAVGAGAGISVAADAVAVDMAATFNWSGVHTFDNTVYINGALGLGSDQLVINDDGTDVDVELQLYRATGGAFSIFWNGVMGWTTKPFRPSELIINRISDTAPSTTYAGMVWVNPNG